MIAVSGLMIGGLYWPGYRSGMAMGIALGMHEGFVNASYVLIILHVAAALYHRRTGDGIWQAMVPSWRKPSGD